jgi:hypothetical protein
LGGGSPRDDQVVQIIGAFCLASPRDYIREGHISMFKNHTVALLLMCQAFEAMSFRPRHGNRVAVSYLRELYTSGR